MITLSVDDQKDSLELMRYMLTQIDPNGTHYIAVNTDDAFKLLNNSFDIIFLDIEMPGMNGLDAALVIGEKYPKLNIVFVTGYPEYSLPAYQAYPVDFIVKPPREKDIVRVLKHLHYPLKNKKIKVRCSPFSVFCNDVMFDFKSTQTTELFAYLVYKNGALCSNGELLGILWAGDFSKSTRLRQLVSDMRTSFGEIGAESMLIKKYGKVGLNVKMIDIDGNTDDIAKEYHWF